MQNKSAQLTAIQKIEIVDAPMPVCGDADVVIQVAQVGVCGSDIHFFQDGRIGARQVIFPMVLGHECAGTVIEAGKNVRSLAAGDRVAVEPGIPCGVCEYCKGGRYNLCPDIIFSATPPVDGVLSRFIRFPAHMCFKLPENVSTLEGALVEPLSVGIHTARLGNVKNGQTVVILGGGCIGLMTLLACRMMGAAEIIISDLYPNRLSNARELGASGIVDASQEDPVARIMELTGGRGADVVFETAGSAQTAYQTSFMVKRGGIIVLAGNIIGDITFNFRNMTLKEASLKTVWRYRNTYPDAIASISRGDINLKGLKVDTFAFEDTQKAFEMAMNNKQTVVKAVVDFGL